MLGEKLFVRFHNLISELLMKNILYTGSRGWGKEFFPDFFLGFLQWEMTYVFELILDLTPPP